MPHWKQSYSKCETVYLGMQFYKINPNPKEKKMKTAVIWNQAYRWTVIII